MKGIVSIFVFILMVLGQAVASEKSLWDELVEVTINHIKTNGPDNEVAEFVSVSGRHSWARQQEFVDLIAPYLKSKNPEEVADAITVLYRFRGYHPSHYLGDFETDNSEFFQQVDHVVFGQAEYFHLLKSDQVYKMFALYLGCSPRAESKQHLLRIANSPIAKGSREQALICLAWHRDPNDMEVLLTFMLEDSGTSRALPYHFRNSYGKASIPYLKRALSQAQSERTRLEAAFELVHLRNPAGFQYVYETTLQDPKSEGKHARQLERIKQFAIDYLELSKDVSSKEKIALYINKKQIELCNNQN